MRSAVLGLWLLESATVVLWTSFGPRSFAAAILPDSNVLERAISEAEPGQTVNLPAGDFAITKPLRLRSGTRLIGAGRDQSIVHYAGLKPGVMISLQDCEDVEVAHLTLDARNDPNVQQGISGGNARWLRLHHLGIRNLSKGDGFGPHAILFAGVNPTRASGVTDSEVSDCLIENIAPDAAFGCGIRFSWGSSRNRAVRNTIRATGRGGIFGDNGSTDLLIRSNVVTGSGGEGLGIEVWEGCDRAVIEDNRIDHWLSIGGSDYCAVRRNVVSDKSGVVKFIGIEGIGAHCVYTDNLVDDGQQSLVFVQTDAAKPQYTMRRVQVTNRFDQKVFVRSTPIPKKEQLTDREAEEGCLPKEPLLPGERLINTAVGELKAALYILESNRD